MQRTFITEVDGVPASPSPISNAVVVDGLCWISGQLSIGDDGSYRPGTAREEAARAFEWVFCIVEAAGFARDDIVYVDLAFIDLDDLPSVNELYAALFEQSRRPARTVYQVAKLPFGGKIKVQAVAARGGGGEALELTRAHSQQPQLCVSQVASVAELCQTK